MITKYIISDYKKEKNKFIVFRNKIYEIMPNLSKGILNQVFYYLSGNNNSIIIDELLKK